MNEQFSDIGRDLSRQIGKTVEKVLGSSQMADLGRMINSTIQNTTRAPQILPDVRLEMRRGIVLTGRLGEARHPGLPIQERPIVLIMKAIRLPRRLFSVPAQFLPPSGANRPAMGWERFGWS